MEPPRPPSPPSGPPRGTNFSRRKDAEPSPPLPAMTSMRASSKNFMGSPERKKPRAMTGLFSSGEGACYCCTGSIDTRFFCLGPCFAYFTWPVAVAKSVWSLPIPTFMPGWKRVPRWRTRIDPAFTSSPPKALRPRRLLSESRPLREDPPAFLCAMFQSLCNRVHTDFRVVLAMALVLLVVLAATHLEDLHLHAA